ncbi:MAG: DUF4838 domain-containing protein [Candidatus Borkfalkiaceae bacterium]|nr:DUF4838 domain-containing protein [Clostridia bacterium]MDY6223867.1 DUF4838 domain-containing protein [Christensenellaceae bacterium]
MKKMICCLLAALIAIIGGSCGESGRTSPGGGSSNTTPKYEESGIKLVENGRTDYRILLPRIPSDRERYAAEELTTYMEKSTGVRLETTYETSSEGKYLSVGGTDLLQSSGLEVSYSRLGDDGFYLVLSGNDLIMAGYGGDGTLFAVYEFLETTLGVCFYAADEIVVPEYTDVPLYKYSEEIRPAFEERALGYLATQGDRNNALRMRLGEGVGNWGLWAHTHFTIINYDLEPGKSYKTDHSDWFSSDGTQLCLTNEEMKAKFIENLKTIIAEKPNAEYFMLGQEDQNTFCTCGRCRASNAENGGESGTQMIFVNSVAAEIKKWLKETNPQRNVTLVTFAYCKTESAPTTYDEATDSYRPVNERVVAADNVGVMFAPIYACFSHDILDKNCNALSRTALLGWAAVSAKLMVWTYSSNYAAYLQPFNNYSSLKADYSAFRENGVVYIYDQGIYNSYDSFHDLRVYIHSKMLWNPEQSVTELEDAFFSAYYKQAAPYVREYYELIKTHYIALEKEGKEKNDPFHTYCTWNLGVLTLTSAYWPKSLLNQCLSIFERAYEEIAKIEDVEERNKILKRTKRESLYARYMILELYPVYYTVTQLEELIDSFEADAYECGVTRYVSADGIVGGPDLSKKITEWRKNLL